MLRLVVNTVTQCSGSLMKDCDLDVCYAAAFAQPRRGSDTERSEEFLRCPGDEPDLHRVE